MSESIHVKMPHCWKSHDTAHISNISGITNPNSETQAELIRELYTRSNIDVNDVGYLEAHGTGTQVLNICTSSVLPAKSDSDIMFCFTDIRGL